MSRLICTINGIIIPVMGNLGIPLACVSRFFFVLKPLQMFCPAIA